MRPLPVGSKSNFLEEKKKSFGALIRFVKGKFGEQHNAPQNALRQLIGFFIRVQEVLVDRHGKSKTISRILKDLKKLTK